MTEDQKLHKQYAFEDFMKTVLRNKARNIHRKLDIQEQREAAASNFDESIFDSLITEDSYVLDTMTSFSVKEHVFVVTPHIGKALSYLQPKHRDILLLSYFAEWSDSKIARYLGLAVSTVNDRRIQALQKLKQIMEYSKNAETFTL
ncbi:MAG: sigma-70 family RNA polymerase sigma factor [Oscillospiraceae bacterium]|nr:sigma-70 family RNA polymerase sigma factor [Oscillospiraceae bacterium]